jgi:hypothetical protein
LILNWLRATVSIAKSISTATSLNKVALEGETLHQRRAGMAPEIEKRQHGRTAVRLPVHILAADGSRQGETEDISLGGAFIRCKKPPPPDAKVLLTYEDLNGNKQAVTARVVWTNLESQGSSNKPIGMGVEFL